jgi:hypothetical protein
MNTLLLNADAKRVSILALLDLSAAFDTLDHQILLKRLHASFGIAGTALKWFASYLIGRHQRVVVHGQLSDRFPLKYGVPQGSVLGPVLFTLYSQQLSEIIKSYSMDHHKYADDTQLIDSTFPANISSVKSNVEQCVHAVKEWMTCNKLKLNGDKTEMLVSGTSHFLDQLDSPPVLCIEGTNVESSECVRDLGVFIDQTLSLHGHISAVCRLANYEIRKLSAVREFLTFSVLVQLVSSLVLSRLDYCNSLFVGLPETELSRLQAVMNNAARMIFRRSKRHHISPMLIQLHWLPVKYRAQYKVATLAFQKFNNALPKYLSDLLRIEVRDPNAVSTRSSGQKKLDPKASLRPRTKSHGERTFAFQAPEIWNKLPAQLREADTLASFKSGLKTHLFREAYKDYH